MKRCAIQKERQIIAILHDIRSAHNVGSMFRTADGAGVKKLYLTGHTPAPIDRFGRPVKEISKTALGAERTIPFEQKASVISLMKRLSKEGFVCVALERVPRARSVRTMGRLAKIALIVGNEVEGLPRHVLAHADRVVAIPMKGSKESLNVGVAFGVAVYAALGC